MPRVLIILVLTLAITGQTALAATPQVTYSSHIAAIVHDKCSACHHPGQAGPFPLLTYDDVRQRAETIAAVVQEDYMPPWPPAGGHVPLAHDRRLTQTQKSQLLQWIQAGCPAGDLQSAPQPPHFPDGWVLGEPDLVVTMDGSYTVPADGPDIHRNFVARINLPENKWIKAIDLRPQARSVVHHVLYFVVDSEVAREKDAADPQPGFRGMGVPVRVRIGGYVPGVVPERLPEDLAYPLPAHTDLVLQTHFHPSGKSETEQLTVGIYFADAPPTRNLLAIQIPPGFGRGAGIDIPAGESNYVITDAFTLPAAVKGYLVSGHAHYICSKMHLQARLPDGTEQTLLQIDDWDLNWQGQYAFQTPVHLPAGTVISTRIEYDNSTANPQNPHSPPQRVRWGNESTDEMGSMTLLAVAEDNADASQLKLAYQRKSLDIIKGIAQRGEGRQLIRDEIRKRFGILDGTMFRRLDQNSDGVLERREVPERSRDQAFQYFDADNDGRITREEWDLLTGADSPQANNTSQPATPSETISSALQTPLGRELAEHVKRSDGALFRQLDANGDGALTREETPERFRDRAFSFLDADSDGRISLAEWNKVQDFILKGAR